MAITLPILFKSFDNVYINDLYQPLFICPSDKNTRYKISENLKTVYLFDFWANNTIPDTEYYNFFYSERNRDKWVSSNI